jgi:imidazolonepropionase-like amidohydrolase
MHASGSSQPMPLPVRTACGKCGKHGQGASLMKTEIVNIGGIVTGDLKSPFAEGDSILMSDGRIAAVGTLPADQVSACDVVIDADRTIAIPG